MSQGVYLNDILRSYRKFLATYYRGDGANKPKGDRLILDFAAMTNALANGKWDHSLSDCHCSFAIEMGWKVGSKVPIIGF